MIFRPPRAEKNTNSPLVSLLEATASVTLDTYLHKTKPDGLQDLQG